MCYGTHLRKTYGHTGETLWNKSSGVRVLTRAHSSCCPTRPGELPELFLVGWTMAGAKRHPGSGLLMEGEITMICVDTWVPKCWFHDQIHAVKIYCERKLKAHPDNLVGIVTSGQLNTGSFLPPSYSLDTLTYTLNGLVRCEREYPDLLGGFELLFRHVWDKIVLPVRKMGAGHADMKKRIVLFTGGYYYVFSPLLSTAGAFQEPLPPSLKQGRVVLDVIDFGPRVKGKEDFKEKYLKALVDAMNDNNENEDGHYFLIEDDGFSLSQHILRSSSILPPLVAKEEAPVSRTSILLIFAVRLPMGEVTMICVDTSITNLCWFHDQIRAVEIYCERKLKAHPNNLVSIARFGQQDFGICLYPTNCLEKVTCILHALKPRKQEYTDLLQGFKLFSLGWFGQADMKKRIVVFSGRPLLSTTGELREPLPPFLKKGCVALDVIDFGPRAEGKEDSKAKYLKALVDAMNYNNEDSHYFLIEINGLSLSHHISNSIIPEETPTISIPDIPDIVEVVDSGWFNDVEEVVDSGWTVDVEEQRLVWTALKSAGTPRVGYKNRKVSKNHNLSAKDEQYKMDHSKDRVNTLLLVATLVATVTFAAAFTVPGGYKNSGPKEGQATLLRKLMLQTFVICDTIALYSSITVAVTLIWAQLGDLTLAVNALRFALPMLSISLTTMLVAFMVGVSLVVESLTWLAGFVLIFGILSIASLLTLFIPLCSPVLSTSPVLRYITCYIFHLLVLASGSSDDRHIKEQ
ncbi:PGG domain-containing protein [Artemisia annua]|uniref:PGG domain-containing protein n=1 Tax=Artemisia annua TaxID=35608 RepID=A0A2U1QH57_ARTAN|nr:PGG domain-containing protein [Artemisia annua]